MASSAVIDSSFFFKSVMKKFCVIDTKATVDLIFLLLVFYPAYERYARIYILSGVYIDSETMRLDDKHFLSFIPNTAYNIIPCHSYSD